MMIRKIKSILIKSSIIKKLLIYYRNRSRKIYKKHSTLFKFKEGIEIGGPSSIFNENGPIPIYKDLKGLDNINFSEDNFWSNIEEGFNFKYSNSKQPGKQIIADAINLKKINDSTYDIMLSSHVIEHIANPIKALIEWSRILKPKGLLVIVAPDRNFTYDRKRPLTKLEHIIDDFKNDVDESDQTHIEEVLLLHDLTNDGTVDSYEAHAIRTKNNIETRIVHHHTFDLDLLINLLKEANFKIIDAEAFRPYHLLVIAQKNH